MGRGHVWGGSLRSDYAECFPSVAPRTVAAARDEIIPVFVSRLRLEAPCKVWRRLDRACVTANTDTRAESP
jgi:hypothetical protein